jgi:formylglycine-generating enzyme required for sulfatase activity
LIKNLLLMRIRGIARGKILRFIFPLLLFILIPFSAAAKQNFVDSNNIEFVWIPGGCFVMGCGAWLNDECRDDTKPAHKVCVDGFYIGKFEITQGQWQKVRGDNPAIFKQGSNYPVEKISWEDTQDFIQKAGASQYKYRLPTEAEWEYAARSGGKNEKYSGSNTIDSVAWYAGNSMGKISGRTTHPVGTKEPNGLGVYDMSGNVWEWCQDWYDEYDITKENNPTGPPSGWYRVTRGGGWGRSQQGSTVVTRLPVGPSGQSYLLGFRLVAIPN